MRKLLIVIVVVVIGILVLVWANKVGFKVGILEMGQYSSFSKIEGNWKLKRNKNIMCRINREEGLHLQKTYSATIEQYGEIRDKLEKIKRVEETDNTIEFVGEQGGFVADFIKDMNKGIKKELPNLAKNLNLSTQIRVRFIYNKQKDTIEYYDAMLSSSDEWHLFGEFTRVKE